MSIEIIVEPASNLKQLHAPAPAPFPQRCPPGCVPAPAPRCPPGCVPACPPGFRRVERLYKCRPARRQRESPRISQIIESQLRKIAEGQRNYQDVAALQRTQSEIAISPNLFALAAPSQAASPLPYSLSHSASISASVEQLPAAIKEVLSVADNVVPQAGKVTYITSASCNPACQRPPSPPPRPCTPPPPPPPPRRIPRPIYRPSSPYEVLPVIHVDRCDPCDPCNRNRRLDPDCAPAHSSTSGYMTIEIEVSHPKC